MPIVQKDTPFTLEATLGNGREDRFIKATLFQGATEVATYSLSHVAGGVYINNTVIANQVGQFTVRYEVFRNAAFTNKDRRFDIWSERIRVEDLVNETMDRVDESDGSAF